MSSSCQKSPVSPRIECGRGYLAVAPGIYGRMSDAEVFGRQSTNPYTRGSR